MPPARDRPACLGACLVALLSTACSYPWDEYRADPGGTGATGAAGDESSASTSGAGASGPSSSAASAGASGGAGQGGNAATGSGGEVSTGGAGGLPGCAVNGTQSLTDDFDDNLIDPKWTTYVDGPVVVSEIEAHARVHIRSSMTTAYGHFRSAQTFDMNDCYVLVRVLGTPNQDTSAYTVLKAESTPDDYIQIFAYQNSVYFGYRVGGAEEQVVMPVDYEPANHAWWRLRSESGMTFWDTSPNGVDWIQHASAPNPIPVDAVNLVLGAGTADAETIDPGNAVFDFFNLPP